MRFRSSLCSCLTLGLLSLASLSITRGTEVNFDNYVSPTDNDLAKHFFGWSDFSQTPTGGITGGAIVPPGFAATFKEPLKLRDDLSVSLFVKYTQQHSTIGESLRLGFVVDQAAVNVHEKTLFFGEYCCGDGLRLFTANDGFVRSRASFNAPEFNSWIKLTFSEHYLGDQRFQLTAKLENYGLSGMDPVTVLASDSWAVILPEVAVDEAVYAGFAGWYNVGAFDNFSVIPEPGTQPLLVLGGLALLSLKRNRPRERLASAGRLESDRTTG